MFNYIKNLLGFNRKKSYPNDIDIERFNHLIGKKTTTDIDSKDNKVNVSNDLILDKLGKINHDIRELRSMINYYQGDNIVGLAHEDKLNADIRLKRIERTIGLFKEYSK